MKKIYLIFFFVSLLQTSIAQDILVFNDGSIREVKINAVDTLNNTIHYTRNHVDHTISCEEIMYYKFEGLWYARETESNQFSVSEKSFYIITPHLFARPAEYNYSKYSISVGYSPGSSDFGEYFERTLFYTQFSNNATIRIEPEYAVSSKVSIKIPIVIGLGLENAPDQIVLDYSGSYSLGGYFYFGDNGYPSNPILIARSGQVSYNNQRAVVHKGELQWQLGVTPKFYPFGQTRNALYFSQSVNWGRGNYNSVDYYYNFDTLIPAGYWTYSQIPHWNVKSESAVVKKNSFNYFRFETLIGINFNVSPSLCFSLESGFSTIMQNRGTTQDHVYMKVQDEDYQLIYSGVYQPAYKKGSNENFYYDGMSSFKYFGRLINRFHLIYKFGGKRIEPKTNQKL